MHIQDLLAKFESVTEDHDGYLVRCPAHNDGSPSLKLLVHDNGKVGIACRAGCEAGDVLKAAGLKFSDLFNVTGDAMTVPAERPSLVTPRFTAALMGYSEEACQGLADPFADLSYEVMQYAYGRFGLTRAAAFTHMIGFDTGLIAPYFTFRSEGYRAHPRLTVPLFNFSGTVHGLQGRDISGNCPSRWLSLTNPKGHRWGSYGFFRASDDQDVTVVTEGPGDGLTALAQGYNALIIRGASLVRNQELLDEIADGLEGHTVFVAGDNDAAGERFTQQVCAALNAYPLCLPDGVSDLTAWREKDPDAFPADFGAAMVPPPLPAPTTTESESPLVDEHTGALIPTTSDAVRAVGILRQYLEQYEQSDACNAHILVRFSDQNIKYSSGLGFYVWNGVVWQRSDDRVRQLIHNLGGAVAKASKNSTSESDAKFLKKASAGFTQTKNIDNLIKELKSVPSVAVREADFDAHPHLLTFRNGTVDLRTGKLRPHDKRDMLTYALDIDYNPDAKCPRWDRFLGEIFPGHPELTDYARRLVGYGISGYTSEQCFAVLHGKGANGKSVFTDNLSRIFKPITKNTPFATFEEKPNGGIPNDIAALRNARLVMASEGEAGKPMSESILKRITGGDEVTARFMRAEFFTYTPQYLIMLGTNHKPKFKGQDEGLWRRVKLIPFTRYFAPDEREDRAKMDEYFQTVEAEGIAAWAVRGAMEWRKDGLQDPEVIRDATKEYRETSDALAGFLPGVFDVTKDESDRILGSDAFNDYLDWCEAENLPSRERWRRQTFYSALEERGVERRKMAKGITLFGMRKAEPEAEHDGPGIFAVA